MVAFVFTDIEGSTRLLQRLGYAYPAVLERHRALLREAWRRHGGHEVDCNGDSFLVAFWTVAEAVAACAAGQRALAAEPWPPDGAVRVRMGVHAGLAFPRAGRYVALAVHQAVRIADVGHGGQVLLSEQAVDELPGAPPRSLGSYRVRNFEQRVQLFELPHPGRLPAVRAQPADGHNFVVPATALIDRDREVAEVEAAVADSRLVTVLGAGGVGKTRVATEVGIRLAPTLADGVWLTDCAPLEEPAMLPALVADALGIAGGRTVGRADVIAALRSRQVLLVLDSCERHLSAVADLVEGVLAGCPRVRVLCTSREPLHLPEESLRRLPPLSTAQGVRSGAVRLFTERARAVRPGFRLDGDNSAVVVALCRRLDGLPLALEIAAARMTVLEPAEILAGLDRQSRMLRISDRTRPERHRGLETLLDWSVQLLTPAEAAAFRRLALLAAGFDLPIAAAAVAAGDVDRELVPELVWSLVDKSLLVADPAGGGTWYRSMETVRAYAGELLAEHRETRACAGRLAHHYGDRFGGARGTGLPWVHAVSAELDTLRSVVWAAAAGPADAVQEEAQQLAATIARYHDAVQTLGAGIDEVSRMAAALPAPTPARVGLLGALALLHVRSGDLDAAEAEARAAEVLRAGSGAPDWDEVGVEKVFGEAAIRRGDAGRAVTIAETALRGRLSARGRARMNNLLGIALATQGAAERAEQAFQEELRAAAELGDETLLAYAHGNLAEMALRLGNPAVAARHQRAGLELVSALGQVGMLAFSLQATARLAVLGDQADWETAVRLGAKAEQLLAESGITPWEDDSRLAEDLLLSARTGLGPAGYATQLAAGRALSTRAAIEAADRELLRTTRVPAGIRH
jgi:predicted ATPase/tetratricopeptide (TPR) repeat protein